MKKLVLLFLAAIALKSSAQITFQSQLISCYNMPVEQLSNLWGYTDSLGNQYALVGTTAGFSIVDINNKTAPTELFNIPYVSTPAWREVKTFGHYAYVTTDAGASPAGLLIVDLQNLPTSWDTTIILENLADIHALHIDEANHKLYLYGAGAPAPTDGALIYDLLPDPMHPTYLGNFNNGDYVHDGEVRNNILYAGHIYDGYASIVDVTNPMLPVVLGNVATPSNFTHNTWLSDDNQTMYTTDETDNSFVASYNISDPTNIIELDRYQLPIATTDGGIVHNVYVYNDYLVMSYYTHGFVVIDAHEPDMLTLIDSYDTSPLTGNSYNGDWGVFPYFNDSTVIVSDMENGLFTFHVNYHRASYLRGLISNAVTGANVINANVQIISTSINDISDLSGNYKMGIAESGTYTVEVTASGYYPKTISVVLTEGVVTIQNILLEPLITIVATGTVVDIQTGFPISNATIQFTDGFVDYTATTNASGQFTITPFYAGTYNGNVGAWGFQSQLLNNELFSTTDSSINIELYPGYFDDFNLNYNWTVSGTAASGNWVLAEPIGTTLDSEQSNSDFDINIDTGDRCYITGNGGGSAGNDDVDNGYTLLLSPIFNISTYQIPVLKFSSWFFNAGGTGTPNDTLRISVTNGTQEVILYQATEGINESEWTHHTFYLNDLISTTSTMRLKVYISDSNPGHIVEGGFDGFSLVDSIVTNLNETENSSINVIPNPATNYIIVPTENIKMVSIVDVQGKICYQNTFNKNPKIDVSKLTEGIYKVIISTNDNKLKVGKFVK